MAKNIEINIKTSTGDYETLYPSVNPEILKLNSGNVNIDNSISEKLGLSDGSTINDVLGKFVDTGVFSGYTQKIENNLGDIWESKDINADTIGIKFYGAFVENNKWISAGYYNSKVFLNVINLDECSSSKFFYDVSSISDFSFDGCYLSKIDNEYWVFCKTGIFKFGEDFNFKTLLSFSSTGYEKDFVDGQTIAFKENNIYYYFGDQLLISTDGENWTLKSWNVNQASNWQTYCLTPDGLYMANIYNFYKITLGSSPTRISKFTFPYDTKYILSYANNKIFMDGHVKDGNTRWRLYTYDISTEKYECEDITEGVLYEHPILSINFIDGVYYCSLQNSWSSSIIIQLIKWNDSNDLATLNTNFKNSILLSSTNFSLITPFYYYSNKNLLFALRYSSSITNTTFNYTQQTYLKDYNLVNSLSELITLGDSYRKVELKSYIGNGQYGSSNPNSITFSFNPKLVIVIKQETGVTRALIVKGQLKTISINTNGDSGSLSLTWNSNGVSWYNDSSAVLQCNEGNLKYLVFAIG